MIISIRTKKRKKLMKIREIIAWIIAIGQAIMNVIDKMTM